MEECNDVLTSASRASRVSRVACITAAAHGGTVGKAIGTGLGDTIGTRAVVC